MTAWLPVIIHPQTGDLCWDLCWDRPPHPWPEGGFPHEIHAPYPAGIWPVPRLKDARLVDCYCGRTGLQPATPEAMVRYIPGAALSTDGPARVTLPALAAPVLYPTGSGEDEVT